MLQHRRDFEKLSPVPSLGQGWQETITLSAALADPSQLLPSER